MTDRNEDMYSIQAHRCGENVRLEWFNKDPLPKVVELWQDGFDGKIVSVKTGAELTFCEVLLVGIKPTEELDV